MTRHPPWVVLQPVPEENIAIIGGWLDLDDQRGAAEQIDSHYPFGGFKNDGTLPGLKAGAGRLTLKYPGDPPMMPLAMTKLRDETVCLYRGDFIAVWQTDGTFVCARFD